MFWSRVLYLGLYHGKRRTHHPQHCRPASTSSLLFSSSLFLMSLPNNMIYDDFWICLSDYNLLSITTYRRFLSFHYSAYNADITSRSLIKINVCCNISQQTLQINIELIRLGNLDTSLFQYKNGLPMSVSPWTPVEYNKLAVRTENHIRTETNKCIHHTIVTIQNNLAHCIESSTVGRRTSVWVEWMSPFEIMSRRYIMKIALVPEHNVDASSDDGDNTPDLTKHDRTRRVHSLHSAWSADLVFRAVNTTLCCFQRCWGGQLSVISCNILCF